MSTLHTHVDRYGFQLRPDRIRLFWQWHLEEDGLLFTYELTEVDGGIGGD